MSEPTRETKLLRCDQCGEQMDYERSFLSRTKPILLHWRQIEYNTYTKCGPLTGRVGGKEEADVSS